MIKIVTPWDDLEAGLAFNVECIRTHPNEVVDFIDDLLVVSRLTSILKDSFEFSFTHVQLIEIFLWFLQKLAGSAFFFLLKEPINLGNIVKIDDDFKRLNIAGGTEEIAWKKTIGAEWEPVNLLKDAFLSENLAAVSSLNHFNFKFNYKR